MNKFITNDYASWPEANRMLADGAVVHASLGGPGTAPLCDDPGPFEGVLVLDLTHRAVTPEIRRNVNCPRCLEWMHA